MNLSSLLFPGEYSSLYDPEKIEISHVCCTSDRITPGCLFVCIRGTRYDSHMLLQTAAAAGAAAALIEEGAICTPPEGFPVFSVKNTRRALAFACDRFCGHPSAGMHLIAVTGTNGKTSTATMLHRILLAAGLPSAVIGTVACKSDKKCYEHGSSKERRTTMTTPDPDILYPMLKSMKQDGIQYVVMEASSHALAFDKLAPLHFDIGIFTNLSPEHLDFHGTMENYLSAKARLFSQCDCGILNFDSEYAERIARQTHCRILRCGAVYHEEYNAEEIRSHGARGSSYLYSCPQLRMPISLPIPGSFSIYNSLLAITGALALGVSPTVAKDTIGTMESVDGRLERLPLEGAPFSVFIDYAHTEAALTNLLSTVSRFRRGKERIVLLFGCGGDRDKSKRAPIGRVAEEFADYIILTSDNSRTEEPAAIIHDVLGGMKNKSKRTVIVNRRRAIEHAILNAHEGDIILLVGKGHETYELVGEEKRPFNEKEIVKEAFLKRQREKGEA